MRGVVQTAGRCSESRAECWLTFRVGPAIELGPHGITANAYAPGESISLHDRPLLITQQEPSTLLLVSWRRTQGVHSDRVFSSNDRGS